MIIFHLFIRTCSIISYFYMHTLVYCINCGTVYCCFKPNFFKLLNFFTHKTLKSQTVSYINCFLPAYVFASKLKTFAVSLCKCMCHRTNLFVRKTVKICCSHNFIICDIFAKFIEISYVIKIFIHYNIRCK